MGGGVGDCAVFGRTVGWVLWKRGVMGTRAATNVLQSSPIVGEQNGGEYFADILIGSSGDTV